MFKSISIIEIFLNSVLIWEKSCNAECIFWENIQLNNTSLLFDDIKVDFFGSLKYQFRVHKLNKVRSKLLQI